MLRPMTGHERHQQEADAEQGERVAVALEVADPPHDDRVSDEGGDADAPSTAPGRRGQVAVEAGDEDEADAVEEPASGEQGAVGPGAKRRTARWAARASPAAPAANGARSAGSVAPLARAVST